MSTTDKQRDDMGTYLLSTRDYWGQYRALKENYFWIATTVYVGALAAVLGFRLQPTYTVSLSLRIVMAAAVAVLFYLVFQFMQKLNQDRFFASDVISSCDALLARLLDPAFRLRPNLRLTGTYREAANLREYLSNLVTELGAPLWTFKGEPNQWNLRSPLWFVIFATIASELLIFLG
jgi:hypothetical protein